ncbi:MAG: hypothetical protein HY960_01885 [Ignavibacteriae bacterium]|nr:hypothetical protein [Ignavibacteriota bacterium]
MEKYNLAIAWNWEYDEDFLVSIERECVRRELTTLRVEDNNLSDVFRKIHSGEFFVDALFDRASDSDDMYAHFVHECQKNQTRIFNNYHLAERSRDKATMHLELMTAGLFVPHSIILPPFHAQQFLHSTERELKTLGKPFIIKPANTTGGGTGVHLNAHSLRDIHHARQEHPQDKYLIQEKIIPKVVDKRRAWFRVFHAFGEVIPCWWDDHTHVYNEVTLEEESLYELSPLRNYAHTIQRVCNLDFFSSEIALTSENKFVVVDYVNEVCDMRLQSKSADGVPDDIVERIVSLLVNEVEITLHRSQVTD